jgi:hypothetical protein
MFNRGLASVVEAYENGKVHYQRYHKLWAGVFLGAAYHDTAFSLGQPPYDPRVGTALNFIPSNPTGHQSVYFPPIGENEERYLAEIEFRTRQDVGSAVSPATAIFFDLLGYYPLISGDSDSEQYMINTSSLTRYTDGEGVQMCIVSQIASSTFNNEVDITYTNQNNEVKTTRTALYVVPSGHVCSGISTASSFGPPWIKLQNGDRGVKNVISVKHVSSPGGYHVIYLAKPLCMMNNLGGTLPNNYAMHKRKNIGLEDGFKMPRIYDGANISCMTRQTSGSGMSFSYFADFTFIWG